MVVNTASIEGRDDKNCGVMHMELPAAARGLPAKDLLDSMEKETIRRGVDRSYTIHSSKAITHGKDNLPGREVILDKNGYKIRSWIILSNRMVHMITVGGPQDHAIGKAGTAFLDSFEITK